MFEKTLFPNPPSQQRTQNKQDTGLRVRPPRDDNQQFPDFKKPHPVGYFSVNTNRDHEPNASQLRYYKQSKKFPFDLNDGLSMRIQKPDSAYDERLDHLLTYIHQQEDTFFLPAAGIELVGRPLLGVEFVCWRGLLRLLMCTPYEHQDNWCIHVTRYMGTFYLCKRDTLQAKHIRDNESAQLSAMAAWGFKFEQHCLTESPFNEPDTSAPVDECAEFSCVYRTKLNGLDLLYAAEMDGIVSEQPVQLDEKISKLESLKFVELKVRQGNLNQRQQQSYMRFKTRNWWCQSFLVGIQDIYVGLRTEKGLVQRIERVEVRSLPRIGVNFWTPTTCTNFLIQFLTWLKTGMAEVNCPYTTYELCFDAKSSRITYQVIKGKTEHSFLPDWYVDLLKRRSAANSISTDKIRMST